MTLGGHDLLPEYDPVLDEGTSHPMDTLNHVIGSMNYDYSRPVIFRQDSSPYETGITGSYFQN